MTFYPSILLAGLVLTAVPALAAPEAPPPKSALRQVQDALTSLAQTVEPTVVNIKSERLRAGDAPSDKSGGVFGPRRLQATGSGVIVRADGFILTNDHVVEGAKDGTVTVTLSDGREFRGKVFPDFSSDLAVVKIDPGSTPLPAAKFADGAAVRPGQWAVAVGSPFDLQNTVTVGVISAVGRHQSIGGALSGRYYPDLLQTDAAINPGNSGGPLFNIDGQVIGINVAIESPVEGSAGVGFAIPSRIARTVMAALIASGKVTRGYLGIAPEDLTPALQGLYGQADGAFVRDVTLGSPAGRAGLQAGDIVTAFNGVSVTGEVSLREAISGTRPGRTATLRFVRAGRPGTVSAVLGTAPALPSDPVVPPSRPALSSPAEWGFSVRTLTAADRVLQRFAPTVRGVLVTDIAAGSPAEAAGLLSGLTLTHTVIQQVGSRPVTTKRDYDSAVAALPAAAGVPFVVLYASPDAQIHQTVLVLRR